MLDFVQKIYTERLITEDLWEEINRTKNINALDNRKHSLLHSLCNNNRADSSYIIEALKWGANLQQSDMYFMTPLMYAIIRGRKDIFDILKNQGKHNYDAFDLTSENVVHLALEGNNAEILKEVLIKCHDPNKSDWHGRTPLHYAAEIGTNLISILLQDKRVLEAKQTKDIFGDTPVDIAARYQQRAVFEVLTTYQEKIELHPKFAQVGLDISQSSLENKLKNYLVNQNRDSTVIHPFGMCNGWCFLYQTYLPDREDEYFALVNFIASWNGEKDTFKSLVLPKILQKKYASAADVFDQFTNDLVWFFHATHVVVQMQLGLGQGERVQQFEMITSSDREIVNIFNMGNMTLNGQQLIDYLAYFRTFPELTIDIGGKGHATSLYITQEGKFKIFDSEIDGRLREIETPEEAADIIIKTKYPHNILEDSYWISFNTFQIKNKNSAVSRLPTPDDFNGGANANSKLHYAILENDKIKIQQLVATEPQLINTKNSHDQTPIDLALLNGRLDAFRMLISHYQWSQDDLSKILSICVKQNKKEFIQILIETQSHLDFSIIWRAITDDKPDATRNQEVRLDLAKAILPYLDEANLNMIYPMRRYPALMMAIDQKDKKFFDLLLNYNISLLRCDKGKRSSIFTQCLEHQDPYYLIQILAKLGDDIDKLDNLGNNILHWAIIKGRTQVVKECLQRGASKDFKNEDDKNAMELLEEYPNTEIKELLQLYGKQNQRRKSISFSPSSVDENTSHQEGTLDFNSPSLKK